MSLEPEIKFNTARTDLSLSIETNERKLVSTTDKGFKMLLPVTAWILATGYWDNAGFWINTAYWDNGD